MSSSSSAQFSSDSVNEVKSIILYIKHLPQTVIIIKMGLDDLTPNCIKASDRTSSYLEKILRKQKVKIYDPA